MSSLQQLQLTEHGRGLLASRRKTLFVVSGALLAGGALAYAWSSQGQRRRRRPEAATDGGNDGDALARNGKRSDMRWRGNVYGEDDDQENKWIKTD